MSAAEMLFLSIASAATARIAVGLMNVRPIVIVRIVLNRAIVMKSVVSSANAVRAAKLTANTASASAVIVKCAGSTLRESALNWTKTPLQSAKIL
jgi:hypothetical protein